MIRYFNTLLRKENVAYLYLLWKGKVLLHLHTSRKKEKIKFAKTVSRMFTAIPFLF